MFPKRGAIALVATTLAVILLISFKTPGTVTLGAASTTGSGTGTGTNPSLGSALSSRPSSNSGSSSSGPPSNSGTAATAPTTSTATATTAPTTATAAATVTGKVFSTPYGPVEVQITVDNGKITDVQALKLPTHGDSGQISSYVKPILASETLQAQSAKIDVVSGATYTSLAYAGSLQSALDQAGIAAATTQVAG